MVSGTTVKRRWRTGNVLNGLVVAFVFASLAAATATFIPGDAITRFLSPGWLPQQFARLVEVANDVQVAVVADRGSAEHPDVALVLVTNETLEELPYLSPVDRGLVARLVRSLDNFGVRIIGLDLVFDQATEPKKDAELLEILRTARAKIVVGGIDERTSLTDRRRAWQRDFLAMTGRPSGFFNLRYDAQESSGNPIIRYRAEAAANSAFDKSFAEALAAVAGARAIPASRRIAWLGTPKEGGETFLTIDAGAVLAAGADPEGILAKALRSQLAGKIVIAGGDFPNIDRHPTPMTLFDRNGMAGVEVHAQILAGMLDGRSIGDADRRIVNALVFSAALIGFIAGWFTPRSRWLASLTMGLACAAVAGVCFILLWQFRAVVPLAGIIAMVIASTIAGRIVRRYFVRLGA